MIDFQALTENDKLYPARLLEIEPFFDDVLKKNFSHPTNIYVSGENIECLNAKRTISIIGTRSPFYKSFEVGQLVARIAGYHSFTVVSGFATGIDYTGHLGAWDAEAPTIAILGSGINNKLPEKPGLTRYILNKGIFISELEPNAPRTYDGLMARDRLTAAMSDIIFVIETDPKGGAVHTAKIGRNLRKKVYTIDWDNSKYAQKHQGGNTSLIDNKLALGIPILDAELEFSQQIESILE